MPIDKLRLLLTALEAEVVEEALEIYVQARPVPIDGRFEYRYRAARSVLESLRQGHRELGSFPCGDDDETTHQDDERAASRLIAPRIED